MKTSLSGKKYGKRFLAEQVSRKPQRTKLKTPGVLYIRSGEFRAVKYAKVTKPREYIGDRSALRALPLFSPWCASLGELAAPVRSAQVAHRERILF